jgi:hypothetical protein
MRCPNRRLLRTVVSSKETFVPERHAQKAPARGSWPTVLLQAIAGQTQLPQAIANTGLSNACR